MKTQIEFKDKEIEQQFKDIFCKKIYYRAKGNEFGKELSKFLINNGIENLAVIFGKHGEIVNILLYDLLIEEERKVVEYEQDILVSRLLKEGYLEKYK